MSRILKFGGKDGDQEAPTDGDETNDARVSQYEIGEILVMRAEAREVTEVLADREYTVMLKLHRGAEVESGEHIALLYERPKAARIDWKEVVERRLGSEVVKEEIEAAHKIAAMQLPGFFDTRHYGLVVE